MAASRDRRAEPRQREDAGHDALMCRLLSAEMTPLIAALALLAAVTGETSCFLFPYMFTCTTMEGCRSRAQERTLSLSSGAAEKDKGVKFFYQDISDF